VIAPVEKISRERITLPEVKLLERGRHYRQLIARTKGLGPIPTAIVHPVDSYCLSAAIEAFKAELIKPILVGPEDKIRAAAEQACLELSPFQIINTEHSHEAAERAVALARECKVRALMRGSLDTDELMRFVDAQQGLRSARRVSHVFAMDVPSYPRPLFLTDAVLNVSPSVEDKRDIIQNAIDLVRSLGVDTPKVAILSAQERISQKLRSTMDAAVLCKMAERGQIAGGILDGPLAFDVAVSVDAAKAKGLASPVAGCADVFVVPDLEAGNILAKQLEYFADAQMAGLVIGARVPVIVVSRTDNMLAHLGSCGLALLMSQTHAPFSKRASTAG